MTYGEEMKHKSYSKVVIKEQKQKEVEESIQLIKDLILGSRPQDLPEPLRMVRTLFALAGGYYV